MQPCIDFNGLAKCLENTEQGTEKKRHFNDFEIRSSNKPFAVIMTFSTLPKWKIK